jgi:chemotaxis protein CheD
MGELSAASRGESLRTLLGSCIGLALFDRRQCVGGLAHMVLPTSRGRVDRPGKFVDTAIPALIAEMQSLASQPLRLTAKVAGGASMFAGGAANIGQLNLESCEQQLTQLRIPILARHCGGQQGRRMTLDTATGKVTITIVGEQPLEL